MKIVNANIHKSEDFNQAYSVFVGTHIGSFKKSVIGANSETPFRQTALQDVAELEKGLRITSLDWSDEKKEEILCGNANGFVKLFDLKSDSFTQNILTNGAVVGSGRIDENKIIAGSSDGTAKVLKLNSSGEILQSFSSGNDMSRLVHCFTDKTKFATGGKGRENCLKVFDVNKTEAIFKSKNVKPDSLQLEIPVWDSDISFLEANLVATCSRHGYLRYYDIRTQRRPVKEFKSSDSDQLSFTSMATNDFTAYLGLTNGVINSFDLRKMTRPTSVFKGATGTISNLSLDSSGKFICSSSLDRFVRIHSTKTNEVVYQNYIKLKGTKILIKEIEEVLTYGSETKAEEIEEEEETEEIPENEESDEESDEFDEMFSKMETVKDNEPKRKKRKM